MYDQHIRAMTTTKNRSLVGRVGRKAFVRDRGLAHTKKILVNRYLISKKRFEHIELPAQLLNLTK